MHNFSNKKGIIIPFPLNIQSLIHNHSIIPNKLLAMQKSFACKLFGVIQHSPFFSYFFTLFPFKSCFIFTPPGQCNHHKRAKHHIHKSRFRHTECKNHCSYPHKVIFFFFHRFNHYQCE